jgi:hypothetical protein
MGQCRRKEQMAECGNLLPPGSSRSFSHYHIHAFHCPIAPLPHYFVMGVTITFRNQTWP